MGKRDVRFQLISRHDNDTRQLFIPQKNMRRRLRGTIVESSFGFSLGPCRSKRWPWVHFSWRNHDSPCSSFPFSNCPGPGSTPSSSWKYLQLGWHGSTACSTSQFSSHTSQAQRSGFVKYGSPLLTAISEGQNEVTLY